MSVNPEVPDIGECDDLQFEVDDLKDEATRLSRNLDRALIDLERDMMWTEDLVRGDLSTTRRYIRIGRVLGLTQAIREIRQVIEPGAFEL